MPLVTIDYEKPETLKVIKGLAKYLNFKVVTTEKKQTNLDEILIPGDDSIDISELKKIFTGKNIDPKKLREDLWQPKK